MSESSTFEKSEMNPDFWHARWRRGEIGFHETSINRHLQEHWPRLRVAPGEGVFVPLCGKSLDLLWLAGQGYRVLGVEISRLAVESFFTESDLRPGIEQEPPFHRFRAAELEILCGNFFDMTPAHTDAVAAVFDRASLIAMPPGDRPRYARHLQGLLRAESRILLITLDYDQTEMTGPPFAVKDEEVRELFGDRFAIERVARADVLSENERFLQRGLTRLTEQVYALRPL